MGDLLVETENGATHSVSMSKDSARASVHAEDVNSNEELNRQRVQAGQIASIFSVST
jgi:hypothetical protein